MNLKEEILREHSKTQASKIVNHIYEHPEKLSELIELFLKGDYRITQRASTPLVICAKNNASLILPYLEPLIHHLEHATQDAMKRNILRILQFIEIPEELQGLAAEQCFRYLQTPKTPVAIQVFSMTVLCNLCKAQPLLARELSFIIEEKMPYSSAAYRSRASKLLKRLKASLSKTRSPK